MSSGFPKFTPTIGRLQAGIDLLRGVMTSAERRLTRSELADLDRAKGLLEYFRDESSLEERL